MGSQSGGMKRGAPAKAPFAPKRRKQASSGQKAAFAAFCRRKASLGLSCHNKFMKHMEGFCMKAFYKRVRRQSEGLSSGGMPKGGRKTVGKTLRRANQKVSARKKSLQKLGRMGSGRQRPSVFL
jgi:hypothetical protein